MQLFPALPVVFTIFASASALAISQARDGSIQFLADLTNQLNGEIVHTTQFFGAFPNLRGSALTSQASAAKTALRNAIEIVHTITQELADDTIAQAIQAELVDNDFLLDISLQLQDFAEDLPSEPFSTTLELYCSTVIPRINFLLQVAGNVVDNGITLFALPPNNCPNNL